MKFSSRFAVVAVATMVVAGLGGTSAAAGTKPSDGSASIASPAHEMSRAQRVGILRAGGPTAVPNSYIVVFKNATMSPAAVAGKAEELSAKAGGKIGHRYWHALRGFEITVGEKAARQLVSDPAVAFVEQNHTVSINGTQAPVPSWGLDRIDQRNLPLNNSFTYPVTGSGVRAYVIDTGIRFSHTDFGGRAVTGFDAIDGGSADDAHGHGTHVAGTVGATDINDNRASFSNFGTCLDIFAPGVNITSAWFTSDTATNTISGTSMASPHTAGAAALVLAQNPSFTPQQVRDYLFNNATNGVVVNPGTGSVNKLLFVVNDGTPPVNDFAVAVSPASGSTPQGGAVSTTVVTTTTAGSPQAVSLSASGLPAGATATFVPPTVTSGANSSLTIQTSASTPAGTYSLTITGTGSSGSRSATFTLVVTGVGGCSSPGQKLQNPGFEAGHSVWQMTPDVIGQHAPLQPPRTGLYDAWLLGYGFSTYDIVQQTVTLPAGCSSYNLSFWMHIDTAEFEGIAFDGIRVQVIVGSTTTTLATWTNLNAAPGYVQRNVNLAAFAGQTILLRFYATEDWSLQTSFVIDDTELNVS